MILVHRIESSLLSPRRCNVESTSHLLSLRLQNLLGMGTVQPIHESQDSKVDVTLLVVDVVALNTGQTRERVSAMGDGGIEDGNPREDEQGDKVRALQCHGQVDRHGVLERMVDGVRVNRGQRDRGVELVVHAVEPFVHELGVHQAVDVVEEEVADDNSDGAVDQDLLYAGQLRIHAEDRELEVKQPEQEDVCDHQVDVVPEDEAEARDDLLLGWLLRLFLDLTRGEEHGLDEVEGHEDEPGNQESHNLDDSGSGKFDPSRRVIKASLCPLRGQVASKENDSGCNNKNSVSKSSLLSSSRTRLTSKDVHV